MQKTNNLQEIFLTQVRRDRRPVTIFLMNGFQMRGYVTGFDAFSHHKSIVDKKTWLDLPMRYQPYTSHLYEKMLHFFLK